jgi:lipopolysaccharide heptosyltransferase II
MRIAGVPRRVGLRGHRRAWLLNQIVPKRRRIGPIDHQVHGYLHLANSIGGRGEVSFPAASERPTSNIKHRILIGLCPGAEYGPAKRWLPERFIETATAVSAAAPVDWVLFGTKSDEKIGEQIATALGAGCTNLIGKTTLDELITRLGECQLLLSNDTGTMHLATMLNVPVVAVFGSTEPQLTGPLGSRNRVIRHHVECSPCFLRKCPIDFRCMHAVHAAEVASAVLSRINDMRNGAAPTIPLR